MNDLTEPRFTSPAVFRNRSPIFDVLRTILLPRGLVLEIASGSGEHITYFAKQLPGLDWQPSDPSPSARASIAAWTAADRLTNVRAPIDIDASASAWPVSEVDAILAINMVHISPWSATLGLMREAGRLLLSGGLLYLYGPFIQADVTLASSNAAFDEDLRQRNVEWGLRRLGDVEGKAEEAGLALKTVIEMPANNLSLVFRHK
jgi:SAM-dependent methyltransferase